MTSNPALGKNFLRYTSEQERGMTMGGTVAKTGLLLSIALLSASWVWYQYFLLHHAKVLADIGLSSIVGFILGLVTIFQKKWAPFTAPMYALAEGLSLGGFSILFEVQYPGVVMQVLCLTFGMLAAMLIIYSFGIVQVNNRFRMVMICALSSVTFVYLLAMILQFFGIPMPYIHDSGLVGISCSVIVVGIAGFSLLLDFDLIVKGQQQGLPKYMEWYAGFALMVTLVWLFLECLRLLAKLRERRRS